MTTTGTGVAKRHYILLANPSPNSFCHAVARAYAEEVERAGQSAEICDLNTMAFDPVLKDDYRPDHGAQISPWVEGELEDLAASDVIVLVYPIWFGGAPAILKGYIDRVFGAGCTVGSFTDSRGQKALRGKWLLSFSTSATMVAWLKEQGQQRSLREGWDLYLERGFAMRDAGHVSLDGIIPNMSTAHAGAQLERVRETARLTCARLT